MTLNMANTCTAENDYLLFLVIHNILANHVFISKVNFWRYSRVYFIENPFGFGGITYCRSILDMTIYLLYAWDFLLIVKRLHLKFLNRIRAWDVH